MAYLGGESEDRAWHTLELIAYHSKIRGEGYLEGCKRCSNLE